MQKQINRNGSQASKIFDNRTLEKDYRTLIPILKKGMQILDVGCGTGAITKDIAKVIGENGKIIGIDNTEKFISSGKEHYGHLKNMELIHADINDFQHTEKFDLIISARTMQWLSGVDSALQKMKSLLKANGQISILDYNHTDIEWEPTPPASMLKFYEIFLKWRSDAGMSNQMAKDLPALLKKNGFNNIEKINSDEHCQKADTDFVSNIGIWSKVAGLTQMVEEGYLTNELRVQAIEEYNIWIETRAESMILKLDEVRATL
ncbi:MAG: class I SAM-dependent methyltransferase [Cyclobacteriaceae bacterium]|nr:class I SAM-dependent methyltransferase [Cyclobacteriaceae bacterium]